MTQPDDLPMKVSVERTLVKWDGTPPEGADPLGHPQCAEILKIDDDGTVRTIYRRATI